MSVTITDYSLIHSKKNDKTYIKYYLLFDKHKVCQLFSEYDEMLESFLKNNIEQDISEYVKYSYNDNIKGFVPYVKYK